MTKFFLHIGGTVYLSALVLSAVAQDSLYVRSGANRDSILIGEPIQLMIEAKVPGGADVHWFEADSIAHFEFIEKGPIDSADEGAEKLFRQHLVLTSFDSGTRFIPPLQITVNNKKYLTDSIRVEVGFSKFDPHQDYHDIKDILEVENPDVVYVMWSVLALTLASIALFVYLLQKKQDLKSTVQIQEVSKWPPFEEAIRSLEALKKKNLAQTGQVKLYYTSLNDILRLFVLRKLNIASMEKTNEELILQIRQLPLGQDHFSQLAEALRMSDFVKFARYQPEEPSNERNFNIIESSIRLLNEIAI
jgi:hypothetical protein